MKLREIAKKTEKEQQKLLEEKREKLRQLRFALTTGKVKNVREVRTLHSILAKEPSIEGELILLAFSVPILNLLNLSISLPWVYPSFLANST